MSPREILDRSNRRQAEGQRVGMDFRSTFVRMVAAAGYLLAAAHMAFAIAPIPTEPFTFMTDRTGASVYLNLDDAEMHMRASGPQFANLAHMRDVADGQVLRRQYEVGTSVEPSHGSQEPDLGVFSTTVAGPFGGRSWGVNVSVAQMEQNLARAGSSQCPAGGASPLGDWTDVTRGGVMGPLTGTGRRSYQVDYLIYASVDGIATCLPHSEVAVVDWGRSVFCPTNYGFRYFGATGGAGNCFSGFVGEIAELNTYYNDEECLGNPCFPATATKVQTFTDYEGPGVRLVRTWRSRMASSVQWGGYNSSTLGRLPRGWTHSYLRRIVLTGEQPVAYLSEGGSLTPLGPASTSFSAYLAQDGSSIQVRRTGDDDWRVYFPDGTIEEHRRQNDASCKTPPYLRTIIAPAGARTTVEYNASCPDGNPDRVVGPFGHTLTFSYTPSGTTRVLESVLDPASNAIDYVYSASLNLLESATYQDGRTEDYLYESTQPGQQDLLTGIIDERNLRYVTFDYDARGRATTTVRAGGYFGWQFVYGTGTTTATDGNSASSVYGYQSGIGNRRFAGVVTRAGKSRSKTNEASIQHRLLSRTDWRGVVTSLEYDDPYHMARRIEASGTSDARTTTFGYLNDTSQLTNFVQTPSVCGGGLSKTVGTDYVPETQLVQQRSEIGYVNQSGTCSQIIRATNFEYGNSGSFTRGNGLPVAIRGPRGVADDITMTYNECSHGAECGQIHTMTDAANHTWIFNSYNAHGQVTRITQPNTAVLDYVYDARQRLKTVTETAGAVSRATQYDYYDNGLLQKVTDPTGAFTQYTYNDARLLTAMQDNLGNRAEYGYDLAGNRTSETLRDPLNVVTSTRTMAYDAFNHLNTISLPKPAGGVDTWVWSVGATGLLDHITDPLTRSTSYPVYDPLGRLKQTVNIASGSTSYAYDSQDNVISVTAPNNVQTTSLYDDFGRVTREVSPDRGTTQYGYDEADNVTSITDGVALHVKSDKMPELRRETFTA